MVVTRRSTIRDADATGEYVRRARRVRARLAHDPARMHGALRRLVTPVSEVEASVRRRAARLPEHFPFQARPSIAEALAAEVERAMEGGVLRYSRRAALLRHAQRAGIPRFEANLIIATVLHRCVRLDPGSNARDGESGWGAAVLLGLAIQAAIAAAAWWVISA